jgi:hypothetical protein
MMSVIMLVTISVIIAPLLTWLMLLMRSRRGGAP